MSTLTNRRPSNIKNWRNRTRTNRNGSYSSFQKTHKNTSFKIKKKDNDYDIHTLKDHHIVFSSKREKINLNLEKNINLIIMFHQLS